MAGSASCSSSSSENYDVFLSFRGEDTRRKFVSHLYTALLRKQIKTYKDDKTLEKGDEVWSALVRAIKNSDICIVVFSKDYASSTWCLKELTQILDCKQEGEIIPVFYEIDPSHVRKQTGSYKDAFENHEKDSKLDEETVRKWKASLKKAANFSGWDSQSRDYSDESNFVDEIVKEVLRKRSRKCPPNELRGLFGVEKNIMYIESLLREVQTIGIWGMGGIGKTTIAKVIFDKLSPQYDGCCFLANVREESEKHGLNHLRNYLLSKLLDEEDLHSSTSKVGTSFVMSRLQQKRVFIVLDDVNISKQLEHLVGDYDCLRSDSRLIVTTRNKKILSRGVKKIYEVSKLKFEDSLNLFSMNAFNQNHPREGFEELTERAVVFAGGNPLALKVLGSSFHSKSREICKSLLTRLEKYPNQEIQNVLRWSYDGLHYTEKKIFLDIACFFKGVNKDNVIRLLDACDLHPAVGIDTLLDRALITINKFGMIEMHDLIQEMGKEIVREESSNELERRSRLWDPEEVYHIFQHNKGSHLIEGIILDMSKVRDSHFDANTLTKMINLRFLKFYAPWGERSCRVYIPSHLELILHKLVYFQWDEFPLQSLPSTICFEKLVELYMPRSNVKKLWDGAQDLVNLKIINLSGSEMLEELPDLSNSLNLQALYLNRCWNLRRVHPSILSLPNLAILELFQCIELASLSSETPLRSLWLLDLTGCSSLKDFSLSLDNIIELNLSQTAIEILPSSIGRCRNLERLNIWHSLKNLPNELSNLKSLRKLAIFDCSELDTGNLHVIFCGLQSLEELTLRRCHISKLPDNLDALSGLKILTLDGSDVESLPASITNLSQLSTLSVQDCWRLQHLPELPPSIGLLKANNCTSLETVFIPVELKFRSTKMHFVNCVKLDQDSLFGVQAYVDLRVKQVAASDLYFSCGEVCFPGNKIPKCFLCGTTQRLITIDIPSCSDLLGFAFCIIISSDILPLASHCFNFRIDGKCYIEDEKIVKCQSNPGVDPKEFYFDLVNTGMILDHVCLWFERYDCTGILRAIEEIKANSPKVSFQFSLTCVTNGRQMDQVIKECGVRPTFQSESEYPVSIDQMEQSLDLGDMDDPLIMKSQPLELELCTKSYSYQDIDELEISTIEIVDNSGLDHVSQRELQTVNERKELKEFIFQSLSADSCKQNAREDLMELDLICLLLDRQMDQTIKECGVWPILHSSEYPLSINQMEQSLDLGMGDKTKGCWDMDDPLRKKFQAWELELGTKSYSYQDINELEISTIEIGVDGSGFDHVSQHELQTVNERKELKEFIFQSLSFDGCKQNAREDLMELDLTCLLLDRFSESDMSVVSEYEDSLDEMKFASEVDDHEEQLLPVTEFQGIYFPNYPNGLELEIDSQSKTYIDNDEIEVGGSSQEIQDKREPLLQNDDKDSSETFSCACFSGLLWKFLLRLISTS